jgi:glycosyltransferase involved in cell wall biosynthesis
MRLTIGIPSYDNYVETWFTVQSLRLHHDLTGCEVLVVDNFGSDTLREFVANHGGDTVRYVRDTAGQGTAYAKNKVFENALGDVVLCIDSHVLLAPGALDAIRPTDNLITGPLLLSCHKAYYTELLPVWRSGMWGIWGEVKRELPDAPFDIWGMGCGCFYTSRKSWLGYNAAFHGFGGEEGYIHEKYRQAGRRVICDPRLVWLHYFRPNATGAPYPLMLRDKARNYLIGYRELGMSPEPVYEAFGKVYCRCIESTI